MAWESRDPQKYLSFYSLDFISNDGKNYSKFKEYKYRVNRSKRFIQLQIEQKSILLSQKDGGQIAIVRMDQDYRSDNFKSYSRKILYLKEKQGKWEIIGEVTF
jgi:murein L,D-transpeptidase YafK